MSRPRVLPFATLIVAAAALPAGADIQSDINQAARLCVKADRALQEGRSDESRRLFRQAVGVVPEFPDAHIGLGQIAMMEKRYEEALKEFESARDGYAKVGEALFEVRMRQFNRSRDEMARLQDTLSQLRGEYGPARPSGGGATSLDQARIENRIAQLDGIPQPKKEAASDPPGEVFFLIANAEFRLGRADAAASDYENCIARNPKHLGAYTNLTVVHWKAGRVEEARATLGRAEARGLKVDEKLKADLSAAKP